MFESIEDACRKDLVAIVRAYAKANGLTVATVSRKFHGNQSFFQKFFARKSTITLSKMAEMVQSLSEAWPPTLPWPKVKVLHFANIGGFIYIVRWKEAPELIKVGFTKSARHGRMAKLRQEAHSVGRTLQIAGTIPGVIRNERSVHRFLAPYATPPGRRNWYRGPEAEAFIEKMLSDGFVWGCQELIDADSKYYPDDMCSSGSRRKHQPRTSR